MGFFGYEKNQTNALQYFIAEHHWIRNYLAK